MDKIKDKVKNLSVRKTILVYLIISLIISFLLSAYITWAASKLQEQIWWKYTDKDTYFAAVEMENEGYMAQIPRPESYEMSRMDHGISEACDFLQTYSVLIFSVAGSCVSVFLFYRNKLKKPIEELEMASQRIADNDLDFRITYENRDEMGHLCHEFDRMRGQLEENNRKLWHMIEDERALRSAVAHDIRSPLSVLKGYQEMLIDYIPDGTIDREKAVEMLQEGMKQIHRMDVFVDSMQKMNSLEHRILKAEQISSPQFEKDIQSELNVLGKEKEVHLSVGKTDELFLGDQEVIMEVFENLLSNAIRYCKKQIDIKVTLASEMLTLSIQDDGKGFQEDAEKITRVFHQKNIKDSLTHTGMGMYLARLYCEKHGGKF
ncbi:MAG TPA: HAMP domain-containing histidine kinase [Candidatus Blautia excrementipullorum]|nr:HAMP domain-containing histidine kinase [Candidatus Blautia excrementipullorum]